MKKGLFGLAGMSIIPDAASPLPGKGPQPQRKIIHRTLGKTGLQVPVVGIGIYDNTSILPYAYDAGLRFFLSSGDYRYGSSERQMGRFLKTKPRDSFIVATGFDPREFLDTKARRFRKNATKDALIKFADESLERMNVGHIDIYNICNQVSRETVLYEPFLRGIEELKSSGRVRFVGIAAHENEPVVLRTTADCGAYDTAMIAYNFRKENNRAARRAIAYAAEKGMGIIAMKTQAGVYWDSGRKNMINMKAALKWALQDENIHTSVPAFSNTNEFDEGFSVMENLALTPSELRDLKISDESQEDGLFCQQCRACLSQCAGDFDIPSVMRCYMYVYGYRNLYKAKETLRSTKLETNPCIDCDTCPVACTMGFDIKSKVTDVLRLNAVPDEFL